MYTSKSTALQIRIGYVDSDWLCRFGLAMPIWIGYADLDWICRFGLAMPVNGPHLSIHFVNNNTPFVFHFIPKQPYIQGDQKLSMAFSNTTYLGTGQNRVHRPGFGKYLPEKSLRPFFYSKKNSSPPSFFGKNSSLPFFI